MPRDSPPSPNAPWVAPPPFLADWREIEAFTFAELRDRISLAQIEKAPGLAEIPQLSFERMRAARLPFYREHLILEAQARVPGRRKIGLLLVLLGPDGPIGLDGRALRIHEVNLEFGLDLSTPALALAYLRFFCTAVQGQEGRFAILDSPADCGLQPPPEIPPPRITAEDREGYEVEAMVRYRTQLFRCDFRIEHEGAVDMREDRLVEAAPALRREAMQGPFRLFPRP